MNNLMAACCIHALQQAGLNVPSDVAVVDFDNWEIVRYLQPLLTTVAAKSR